jgi:predicted nucleic acid-binding protein
METVVIDASVAVKWMFPEKGSELATGLRSNFRFAAPEMLMVECVNVFWKKVRRGELTRIEAVMASRLLQGADIELFSMRGLVELTNALASDLAHPAYDCIYLALAQQRQWRFVTADKNFVHVIGKRMPEHARLCISLDQALGNS